jgi:hypothetical protein
MVKKCIICEQEIFEEYGKLKGTLIKLVENKKTDLVYVCSNCQKDKKWIEKAKVKSA